MLKIAFCLAENVKKIFLTLLTTPRDIDFLGARSPTTSTMKFESGTFTKDTGGSQMTDREFKKGEKVTISDLHGSGYIYYDQWPNWEVWGNGRTWIYRDYKSGEILDIHGGGY